LSEKLAIAEKTGKLPKVVIPVHMCGQACELEAIHALAKKYRFHVVEDASHAIGGRYKSGPVGDGRYSTMTVFSFHPVKIVTTAEGGMVVTNDPELAWRMAMLRTHGITREPERMQLTPPGPCYYEQQALGYNYRLTDLHAALG